MREFEGRVSMVTGAGSGIGRVVAREFARSGAEVVVTDASPEGAEGTAEEIRRLGAEAVVRRMDVTSEAEVVGTVAEVWDPSPSWSTAPASPPWRRSWS
jgi:NAD(P)-dependent dehydrogenase (short-subunit alcohol dehydrogenase family)